MGKGAGMELTGLQEMNKRLFNLMRALPKELKSAVAAEAEITKRLAQSKTPIDTGMLHDSARVGQVEFDGHEVKVPIIYGNDTVYYAIYVHEDLTANHPNGGEAKFLEKAIWESAPGYKQRIAARILLNRLAT